MTIQKVINNGFGAYKSSETAAKPSWGVERVNFDGLVEASSSTGNTAFRLPNRDPRFLFENGVGAWFYSQTDDNTGSGNFNNQAVPIAAFIGTTGVTNQTVTATLTINFYGTDLNLLIGDGFVGGAGNGWSVAPVVDGTAVTTITRTSGQNSNTIAVNNQRSNQILPLNLNLTAGDHTVVLTISLFPGAAQATGAKLPVFGCEIINEKTNTTGTSDVSNGSIFSDGYRYDLSSETGLSIIPTAYGSNTAGGRVVNYLNPLDKTYDQALEIVPTTSTVEYQAIIESTDTWNIPASVTEFTVVAHGAGGTGGTASFRTQGVNGRQSLGAGSGGGGGAFLSTTYTKTAGSGGTLSFTLGTGGSGTSTVITGGGTGLSGSVTLPAGISGIGVDRDDAPANTENFVTGSGGNAGTAPANATITGLTASNTTLTSGIAGGDASYQTSPGTFSGTARGTTAGAGGASGPSAGGVAGNNGVLTSNTSPSNAGNGEIPGAGGGGGAIFFNGGGDNSSSFFLSSTGAGATGRIVIRFTGASGLGDQGAGFQEVVDHTNEEVIRKINWREFGASNTSPRDFSTVTSASTSAQFTLDDGTTSLYALNIGPETIRSTEIVDLSDSASSFISIVFVGTGLDIEFGKAAGTIGNPFATLDGVRLGGAAGVIPGFSVNAENIIIPIISGLPYGTHTLRVEMTSKNLIFGPSNFIIYGPKKPTIPTAAVEIADYNIVADYSALTSAAEGTTSTGVIGRSPARSFLYGTSSTLSTGFRDIAIFGNTVAIQTINVAYLELTFFGTGIELHGSTASANNTPNMTMRLDGALLGSTGTVTTINSTLGSSIWTRNGSLAATVRHVITISGLPLGLHTVRATRVASSPGDLDFFGGYVISPIHYQDPDFVGGGNGIGDVRGPLVADATDGDTILFQRKTLESSVTSSNTDIAGLTFNNLEIGKIYRLSGNTVIGGGGDNGNMEFYDAAGGGGNNLGSTGRDFGVGTGTMYQGVNIIFKAQTTRMISRTRSMASGVAVRQTQTFLILEELPNHIETRKW